MKVYTITLTVESEAKGLAKMIKSLFGDEVLACETRGPFEITDADSE